MARRQRRSGQKRSLTPFIVVGLVAVTIVVAYYIFTSSPANQASPAIGEPVSPQILAYLTGVSDGTLNSIGPGSVSGPTAMTPASPKLLSNGKPEVFYIGGEYCPYCAVERWAMLVAFSRFGNFSGVEYMISSATDTPPSIPTFTFAHASYTSNYITFAPTEQYDRNNDPYQTPPANESQIMTANDPQGSIPFIDFANQYVQVGSQFSPPFPVSGNWSAIAPMLNTPSSPVAQNVDAAANRLITTICKLTSNQPSSVCSEAYAQVTSFDATPTGPAQLAVTDVEQGASEVGGFAPVRAVYGT
jgi:hypothetical protein